MKRSSLYLGESVDYERKQGGLSRTALAGLHKAAQRVAWGILMGDRLGIDLDASVAGLLRRHPDHFAAHVTAAHARRAQGREAEAEQHLAKARTLAPADHPWASMLPTEAQWRASPLVSTLVEEQAGRVYRVVAEGRAGQGPGNRSVARFLRMRSGELVYINPVALPDDVRDAVRGLGDVTHIIAPAKYHNEHAQPAKDTFPKARLWGVAGHANYPNVKHVKFDGFLRDDAPLFPGELEHVTMQGVDVGDAWIVDRASRTLITTDALFIAQPGAAEANAFRNPFGMFYNWAWGVHDRTGIPSYQPPMWSDLPAYAASIRRALALDFDHVGSCHGSFRAIEGDAPKKLQERLGWLHELGRGGAALHIGNFIWRHPGFFATFVKEQIAARQQA